MDSKAPEKVWIQPGWIKGDTTEVPYIREDLVLTLVEALEGMLICSAEPVEVMERVIGAKKALAALEALKGVDDE